VSDGALRPAAALLAIAVIVAGCLPRVQRSEPVDVTHVYTCAGNVRFSIREFGDVATIRHSTRMIALPRVRIASGVRYATDTTEFLNRRGTATLRIGGTRYTDCTGQLAPTPHDVARFLGVDYRAIGREPAWSLEIDEGQYMRFAIEGGAAMYMDVPTPTGDAARRVYLVDPETEDFRVVVEEKPCRDRSTQVDYPNTVTVIYNGLPYPGCGGPLPAG
jgi:hypothetical protein